MKTTLPTTKQEPQEQPERRLKTHMSQVYYKAPGQTEPTPMPGRGDSNTAIYTMDELLGGGL